MKTSYILMIITVISKVFGLVREKALAYFFGVGMVADVFLVAFQIPMTFTNVISGATANGYIPIYNQILEQRDVKEANSFTANLANIVFIFTFLISIAGIIFAKPLVKAMAMGFEGEKLQLAVFMTRVGMFSICATSVFSIFKAFLQIKKHFIVSVLHAIVMNIIIIASMAISYKLGASYLAWGILAGFVFQYVIFLPYIKKSGYTHSFKIKKNDENLKRLFKIIIPVLISTSVIELNFIISKSLASSLFGGAISTLNYAYKLQSFVTGIVITSITTAVYPEMARRGALNDIKGLRETTSEAISTMALLVIPASVGLFLFAGPIVELLFVGGAFTAEDGQLTALVLSFYAFGIIGIGVREIVSRVFYTVMDARTPVVNSVIMVVINVGLSIFLSRLLGIKGLALATSISFIIGAVLIVISLRKKLGSVITKKTTVDLIKIIIATAVMGIVSLVVFKFLSSALGNTLSLFGAIAIAGITYLIMLILLKVSEIYNLISKFKNR
ncbi:murein biosynthesis integral membrane protein MurJ [Anaerosphaera multitolerans]|uniref:Probable lipid II flippase MurJ n=1 Tax=Anaerosphaera multitolerans TaxID=2487351 RepID=A0A437S496_9FIRM|nr:murein biosynthesis integral membrane protein MurJ [Anaerosphaera multitolerans]RVU53839.1 murein biosynthesis integral membrane protein MurJ [Anaerosphaera multitolerans]